MFAGILFGIFFPHQVPFVAPLGQIFIRLLKLIVVPFIFVSIVDGIIRVGSMQKLSELGIKTTIFYLTTNVLKLISTIHVLLTSNY